VFLAGQTFQIIGRAEPNQDRVMEVEVLDYLHRVFTGQTVSPMELRIAGFIVVVWFLMDAIEWSDWLLKWR
jgi:hypothetical protein